MKPRVVLDTNVVVSAIFYEGGNEARVLDQALEGRIQLLASLDLLEEYREIVSRTKFNLSPLEVLGVFTALISLCRILLEPGRARIKCRDPDDQKFLDCAAAGRADFIVTGDPDLLSLKRVGKRRIVTAREFVTMEDSLFRLKPVRFRRKVPASEIDRFVYHH